MNLGNSILSSENKQTCEKQNFMGGQLQVLRMISRDTYALSWQIGGRIFYLAAHPNGHSCKNLADRMIKGDPFRILEQREYILKCGGRAAEISSFSDVHRGEKPLRATLESLFRVLP